MAIEHAHENGNARQRPRAEIELLRRQGIYNLAQAAVGRRHDDAVAHWRHPRWIAEEIRAPQRRNRADPAERRPEPKQYEAHQRKAADERIALRMDRRELRADGFDDRHRYSAASAAGMSSLCDSVSSAIPGGLRLGAASSSPTSAKSSRAFAASRCRFHMLA